MTEKELRESLKTYLAPADLPDSRKQAILAQIREEAAPAPEKGEPNMFRPNKFRTVMLVAAIVTLLSFTVAVAAGLSGYVNFKGESVDAQGNPLPTPMPLAMQTEDESIAARRDMDALAQEILNLSPSEQLTHVSYVHNGGHAGSTRTPVIHVDTLEELFAFFPAELPALNIPEGFTVSGGTAYLLCDGDSNYEFISEETTEDGLTVQRWCIPEGEEKAEHLSLIFSDAEGNDISVSINLEMSPNHYFSLDGAESVAYPEIPGMDDAILIIKPDNIRLAMRRALDTPVVLQDTHILSGPRGESTTAYPYVTIQLYSRTVPAEVLLSIFTE